MGIDYSFNLAVGFRITGEQLEKKFGWTTAPSYRMEKRFDSKTGNETEPEKVVVEEGGFSLRYQDEEFDSTTDLMEAVCADVKATFHLDGSCMTDEMDFVVGPMIKRQDDTLDEGHITVGGSLLLGDLDGKMKESVRAIGARLRDLGLDPGEPVVTISRLIS